MKEIDLATWPRRTHYEFYRRLTYPHFNICADLDVAPLRAMTRRCGYSFFGTALHIALQVVNELEELRYRIRGDRVVLHETVHARFTAESRDGLFGFGPVQYHPDLRTFCERVEETKRRAREDLYLEEDRERDDFVFVTSVHWVHFTSIQHPIHLHPVDSVPRIAWGKWREEGGRLAMPLALQAHHGLVDGRHAGRFYERFQALCDRLGEP